MKPEDIVDEVHEHKGQGFTMTDKRLTPPGRKARAEARSSPVPVRFSPDERLQIQLAAALNFQPVSEFVRAVVLLAANDFLDDVGEDGV